MSLKSLFKENKFGNVSTTSQDEELIITSKETVAEINKTNNEFVPNVDYSDPKNFAKFGSAQEYYSSTIENIYSNYPYDGSKKHKQEFYNSLALYEKYIFDKEYPKTTGYIHLTQSQYIFIDLNTKKNIETRETPDGNLYNIDENLTNSLFLNSIDGNTVEFWYKQDNTSIAGYLFDLTASNNQRLSVYHSGSNLCVTYQSGTNGITGSLGGNSSSLGPAINWDLIKNNWHHYALTFISASTGIQVTTIIDGNDSRSPYAFYQNHISGTSIESFDFSTAKA